MDKFFFSPLVEDFDRFGLLSCLLPYSVSLCVVPLLECTSSINAVKGEKERNQFYSNIINEDTKSYFANPLHWTSKHSYQGLPYLTLSIRDCKVQKIPVNKIIHKTVLFIRLLYRQQSFHSDGFFLGGEQGPCPSLKIPCIYLRREENIDRKIEYWVNVCLIFL